MSNEYIPSQPKETDEWTIYSTKWCGPCKKLKKFMKDNNIEYIGYDLGSAENTGIVLEQFEEITDGYDHIPMAFHKGKFIGGYSDTKKYIEKQLKDFKKDEKSNEVNKS
jgi:glutaredoxin